jgi:thiol:disulfide interchange protein DsbA
MTRAVAALFGACLLACAAVVNAAAPAFVEGRNYTVLVPAQRTAVPPGKVEVLEVFSYGCPACNTFQPLMEQLRKALPPNAQLMLLHAAFNKAESWPLFQRAYFTAASLGVADRAHQAMFDAIWKTGELAIVEDGGRRLKNPPPTMEQVARFYQRTTGVPADKFVAASKSFSVDARVRSADQQIVAMAVPGTPCLVVNGKYRIEMQSLTSLDELIQLVNFLVAKESRGG